MRFLKSLPLALTLFLGLVVFVNKASAQDMQKDMMDRVNNMQVSPEKVVADMKDKLGIDDDQAAKLLPVIEAQTTGMKAIMLDVSSGKVAPQDALPRMQEIKSKTESAFAEILTPEQLEKLKGIMQDGERKAAQMMQQGNFTLAPEQN